MTPRILKTSLLSQVIAASLLAGTAFAQTTPPPNEGLKIQRTAGSYEMSWWGVAGRTYFVQQTNSLLTPWQYLPLIESGANSSLAWGFSSTAPATFLRLRYSDIPTSDPFAADFDGDKVGNFAELTNGTDPLRWLDSDNDGIPDDWEIAHALNPFSATDAADNNDTDTLTNLAEYQQNTNPYLGDSDADGLPDDQDTAPTDADYDGDGFKDGEDRWPDDPRRGDFIPPKYIAVTDLTAFLTEQERTGFTVEHIAVSDENEAAFVGTFEHPIELDSSFMPVKYIRAYRWKDGAIVGRSEHLKSWWSLVGNSTKHPGPAPLEIEGTTGIKVVEFSFTPRDIASDGTVVGSGWNKCTWYSPVTPSPTPPVVRPITSRAELALGFSMDTLVSNTVLVNLDWSVASDKADPYEPFTAARAAFESDYDDDFSIPGGFFEVAENRGILTIFGGTHINVGTRDSVRDAPIQTQGQPTIPDKPDHFTIPILSGSDLGFFADIGLTRPADTANGETIAIGAYPNIPLEGSANPKGNLAPDGSMIFKIAVTRYVTGQAQYKTRYLYKNGSSVQEYEAPEGIVRMNIVRDANGALTGLHQAIGFKYNSATGDNDAFFAWEDGTRGNWSQMPLQYLLKWTGKTADTKDDYDRYFARTPKNGQPAQAHLKYIVPKLLTENDRETAGVIINGVTFQHGVPRRMILNAQIPNDDTSAGAPAWVDKEMTLAFVDELGYRLSTRNFSNPQHPLGEPLALNNDGSAAGAKIVTIDGTQAQMQHEVSFDSFQAYRGFDIPLVDDEPGKPLAQQDFKNPKWHAVVGYKDVSAAKVATYPDSRFNASKAMKPDPLTERTGTSGPDASAIRMWFDYTRQGSHPATQFELEVEAGSGATYAGL